MKNFIITEIYQKEVSLEESKNPIEEYDNGNIKLNDNDYCTTIISNNMTYEEQKNKYKEELKNSLQTFNGLKY